MSSLKRLQDNRYYVLKKLDEGGRGVIYKAKDTVLNRVVAIKMFKKPFLSEEARSRFLQEAQSVAKLNHPNIVSIQEIGMARVTAQELGIKGWFAGEEKKEEEKQFFVLEFVDGMSLRNLMATYPERKCDTQTVLRTAVDVCKALQYAHSQAVLHGDIKPEDILITEEGVAKLMDFGLAEMLGEPSITQEGIIVTTVAYVAPEIALGKDVDARSDLYSLGAVLYEMATGQPPFPGEEPAKIMFSHIHDQPASPSQLNPQIPQALANCIMKLLEKEPGKRYQTATELLRVLREITGGFLKELYAPSREPGVVVPSPRPPALKEIQLIDRGEEMAVLREAVDRAVEGKGGVVFLHGEAGIGKTRLTKELGAYARLRNMQVLSGRCPALFRMDGVPPYVLWKEVIKDYLEDCTPQQLYRVIGFYPDEVSKLVPELRQKLGTFPQSPFISPEHGRDRLFEAVSQFVTNISKETPLLVILDDLQWTDQTSLLLLHYLARGVYKDSLLLLGAYRHTYVDKRHPLSPVLTELNRERLLQSISLKRLSFDDAAEMIKRILEQDDVPREFCKLVFEKTGGNPFFVEEVIKSLKEAEIIYREKNRWKIREVSKIEFPETVKDVIKARIGRLGDECQNVLTVASFIGKDFTFEALSGVSGFEEDKLIELMEKMLKTGLVKERVVRGEDVYSFADIIVRDVVHEEVSRLRHKRLHGVVGGALEKVYTKNIDEHFGELAYHFLEGGDKQKALDYFLKAGEKAEKVYAYDEGFSYLQHALELLEEKEGRLKEKVRLIDRLGDLKFWIGEFDLGMEYWNRSLTLWNQIGDKKNVARLHVQMAQMFWNVAADKEKASEHHHMALEILEKEPESVELAGLYEDISHMLWRTGESAKALPWTQKAFELAERLDKPEVLAACYNDLAVISMKSGEYEKATEYFEKGLEIALENNLVTSALTMYNNLSELYWLAGEFQKGFETAEKGLELAKKVSALGSLSWIGSALAMYYMRMGKVQKTISMLEDIIALDKRTKFTAHISYAMRLLGACYYWLGEWDKSLNYLTEARDTAKKTGEYQASGTATLTLGELFMEMKDYAEAEKYFNESNSISERAEETDFQLTWVFPALSKLYLKKGEIEKAKELVEKTHEYATKTKNKVSITYAEMLKAMLLREQKHWEQSIQHFEKSLQGYKSLNAQKWCVDRFTELLYEYGLMYLSRNRKGDREEALNLLNQALEIFQKMGAKKDIEKIIAKKKLLAA